MVHKKLIINDKLISIPPYISTSWSSVVAIHTKGTDLVFSMKDSSEVLISDLPEETIADIFEAHSKFLQIDGQLSQLGREGRKNAALPKSLAALTDPQMSNDQIFRIGIGSIDEMGQAMQHNSDHKNAPDLPKELLEKIAHLIQMITPNDPDLIPKAEPHCNCMHCQIARAITLCEEPVEEQIIEEEEEEEEAVLDEELQFSQFEIEQMGNYLFHVKDKLAPFASFTVHLKDPVGCTCGIEGCEHVVAVLKS